VSETSTAVATRDGTHQAAIRWLEDEFPGWQVSLDVTSGWRREARPLWVARQPGRHPQAELSAAKLHTRLTDYHEREARRRALAN
jgi:hypothetical protein